MNFAYWLDAWIYRSWYKKCIKEICLMNSDSQLWKEKIREKNLELIEKNGIPMAVMEMKIFAAMEKSLTWGFWYWVKRMEKKLIKKGLMDKEEFQKIAEDFFYPFMIEKIWKMRDTVLGIAIAGKRKRK